jgi:hypothetical protein
MSEANMGKPINRREFLAIAGLGLGSLASEYYLGPYRNLIDWLKSQDAISEGSPFQRAAQFEKILIYATKPENQGIAAEVCRSWLGFNAAEYWAKVNHRPLTEKCIRHFLYGGDKPLVITNEYIKSFAKESFAFPNEQMGHSPAANIGVMIDEATFKRTNESAVRISNKEQLLAQLESEQKPEFDATIVVLPAKDNEDLKLSLNSHILGIHGQIVTAVRNADKENLSDHKPFWTITLYNPDIEIFDRYDWNPNAKNDDGTPLGKNRGVGDFAVAFLEQIGIANARSKIEKFFGKAFIQSLDREYQVGLTAREGALLARTGFGFEYDIYGAIHLNEPLTFNLREALLKH